jgi:hypothetical protein
MENRAMSIWEDIPEDGKLQALKDKPKAGNLHVILKRGFSSRELYHSIIIIMEWSQVLHKVNVEEVFDWLKEKGAFKEHVYNPVV